MTRTLMTLLITVVLLSSAAQAADPPGRPLALTPAQFDALSELEARPQNTAIQDMHASYKSEREQRMDTQRLADDALTATWSIGMPATILILVIAGI